MDEPIHLSYEQFKPDVLNNTAHALLDGAFKDRKFLRDMGILAITGSGVSFLLNHFLWDGIGFIVGFIIGLIARTIIMGMERRRATHVMGTDLERSGPHSICLDAVGFHNTTRISEFHLQWRAITEICDIGGGTGLVTASCIYPLPDDGLPGGLLPEDFRKILESWRAAAHGK